jgi:uroporphyrinogen decarboxylase
MISRERVLAALAVQQADRVPFMEGAIDWDMQVEIMGRDDFTFPELAAKLGLDCIWVDFLPPLFVETERTTAREEFIERPLLTSPDDLSRVEFPDATDATFYQEATQFIDANRGDYAVAARVRLGASPTLMSMGLEGFAYALVDHPGLVETILDRYTDWTAEVVQRLPEVGVDFIWSFDDMAHKTGAMFSPKVFRQVFLPRLRKVADAIHTAGLPWVFHSDGNLMPILDDLLTLGMNGLHPIEPGAMDINKLKLDYGHRVCLVGNIDLHYTLTRGTPAEVEAEVRDRIEHVGRGGGYIVSSSNSITSYCKLENILAMRDAVVRYGWYGKGS